MNRGKGDSLKFYCFSPPVMLATFFIEITFLAYSVIRYKFNTLTRLVAALLFFLALFQLAEYNVCGGMGTSAATWSRIGFVAITVLPPIGIHLLFTIAKKPWNNITGAAYGMAAAWVLVFAFSERAFSGHMCAGNYVIFQIKPGLGALYFIYYYLWLFIGAYLCAVLAKTMKRAYKESLTLLALGYATLLIPTTMANMLNPETVRGIPSIMCGFAIILAGIVTFGILPRVGEVRQWART
ncbi:MAG TPA: hypothetical protein VFW77_03270 [Candidatus Saccharimonadales bacterium]|nr:hypothetical protein [Candidatus Saccharimonadales bacterium]